MWLDVQLTEMNVSSAKHVETIFSYCLFIFFLEMDEWEMDRTDIVMKHKLGGGQYGDVYEAIWKRYNVTIAVKTLRVSSPQRQENCCFLLKPVIARKICEENIISKNNWPQN